MKSGIRRGRRPRPPGSSRSFEIVPSRAELGLFSRRQTALKSSTDRDLRKLRWLCSVVFPFSAHVLSGASAHAHLAPMPYRGRIVKEPRRSAHHQESCAMAGERQGDRSEKTSEDRGCADHSVRAVRSQ
jgi:hypothetical protein